MYDGPMYDDIMSRPDERTGVVQSSSANKRKQGIKQINANLRGEYGEGVFWFGLDRMRMG